jgi:hypothetical protein
VVEIAIINYYYQYFMLVGTERFDPRPSAPKTSHAVYENLECFDSYKFDYNDATYSWKIWRF